MYVMNENDKEINIGYDENLYHIVYIWHLKIAAYIKLFCCILFETWIVNRIDLLQFRDLNAPI